MNIQFSKLDLNERPTILLETMDFKVIGPLSGFANEVSLRPMYNEVSEITFVVPAFCNGEPVPFYDDIVGMRIAEVVGVGRFVLVNPKVTANGIFEKKECAGYSLEYETTFKRLNLSSGTYNLWNPLKPENTILGMFMKDLPAWKHDAATVEVDVDLIDRYRTFKVSDNWYNFLKGTAQKAYQCIFEFDNFNRVIRARAVKEGTRTNQIFISLDNLAKQIDVAESTDDIFTCMEPYGANGLDIRSVNPLGTNKIYNLDYFMTEKNFSSHVVSQWDAWKKNFASMKDAYYSKTIERALLHTQNELAKAKLQNIQNDITQFENLYSAAAQGESEGKELEDGQHSKDYKKKLDDAKKRFAEQEAEIKSFESLIEDINKQMSAMNEAAGFPKYFTQDEINQLSLYLKETSLTESSFVAQEIVGYNDTGRAYDMTGGTVSVSSSKISEVKTETPTETLMIDGGSLSITGLDIDGMINFGTIDIRANKEKIIMSTVIKTEKTDKDGNKEQVTANVSIVGVPTSITHTETTLTVDIKTATVYYTTGVTEYQRQSVQWELYDYASDLLEKVAYPSYTFSVDSANFIAASDFEAFKNRLELGQKLYLRLNDDIVLQPIVIGADMAYGNPESFSLTFADQFNANTGEYRLKDLLEQSVNMGGTVDSSKLGWNSWQDTGASTVVSDYMNSALNAALQSIISSTGQEVEINGSGIHLRKPKLDAIGNPTGDFEPYEIWMNNNSIMFTDDGWETAKMAIGKGPNGMGIIAEYLIGKFMASEKLTITNAGGDFLINENGITVRDLAFKIIHSDDSGGLVEESFEDYMADIQDAIKNGVISSFSQPERPDVTTGVEGDIWFDTDDNNKTYRLSKLDAAAKEKAKKDYGYTDADFRQLTDDTGKPIDFWLGWISVEDARIDHITQQSSTGETFVKADTVSGAANLVSQNMKFTATNTEFNGEGMWMVSLHQGSPNGVVWMNGSGIMISRTRKTGVAPGTSPYSSAYWDWTLNANTTVLDSTGVAANKFIGNSIFGNIELGIGPQKISGDDTSRPFYVNAKGKLYATGANISGIVDAKGFKINGHDALNSADQITADFLDLTGLRIHNGAGETSLDIDSDGNLTIYGTGTLSAPTINGGVINGAEINIKDERSGIYIWDNNNVMRGQLYYDNTGAGTSAEASDRVYLNAANGALKLNASGDISIGNPNWSANGGKTYIYNPVLIGNTSGAHATAVFG